MLLKNTHFNCYLKLEIPLKDICFEISSSSGGRRGIMLPAGLSAQRCTSASLTDHCAGIPFRLLHRSIEAAGGLPTDTDSLHRHHLLLPTRLAAPPSQRVIIVIIIMSQSGRLDTFTPPPSSVCVPCYICHFSKPFFHNRELCFAAFAVVVTHARQKADAANPSLII